MIGEAGAVQATGLLVDHPTSAGPLRALDLPAFEVAAGTMVAVCGPSGCGKSTLLGVLAGLARPSAGSVSIGTTTMTALSESDRVAFRRRALGIVYQADNLLPFLTVEENVRLQLGLCGDGDDPAGHSAGLLGRLGLGELGGRLPDELSGGQRQRVAVARAVVHRPAVILADEPTGALDRTNADRVVDLLVEAQQDLGATLVMVTHDPAVAARMDRTIELRDGRLVDPREDDRAG